jgi:hypothetical protein
VYALLNVLFYMTNAIADVAVTGIGYIDTALTVVLLAIGVTDPHTQVYVVFTVLILAAVTASVTVRGVRAAFIVILLLAIMVHRLTALGN